MPRRVQDIVPNTHRSIRDIPVERPSIVAPIQPPKKKTGRSVSMRKMDIEPKEEETEETETVEERPVKNTPESIRAAAAVIPPRKTKKSGAKKWLFMLMGIVVIVAIAGYVASVYFSRASFTIVPKVIPFSVNSTYISQSTPGKGVLTYELAVIKGDSSATVPATDGPKISTSAKGKITLYNSFSAQSQRLIAGTRFADDTGRIYRLASSVVIPGSTSSGSSVTPGSISASVTADQPGQSYNITKSDPVSDFKIVAYKGTAKYDSIYGRIASDITGGFVGAKKTINPTALASTTADLQTKISSTLLTQLKTSVPAGYIMYPKAYVSTFSTPTVDGTDPKSATVTLKGTVYGILFKRSDLVARVAGDQAVAAFDNFSYETPGLESLDFSIANAKDFSPEKKNTLIIKLKGDAMMVGNIPVDEMKRKLAGLSLAETSTVLRSYKPVIEIEKSSGSITPPWSKVPSDTDRITVEVLTK
jgi:hypothetical protein